MTGHLIITTAFNYAADRLKPFLRSAAKHCPNADILLFADRDDSEFLDAIAAYNGRTRVVVPKGYKPGLDLYTKMALRRSIKTIRPDNLQRLFPSVMERQFIRTRLYAPLHMKFKRFGWANAFLQDADPKPGKVLLSDSRDVFFQGDPFTDPRAGLVCGEEPLKIGESSFNAKVIEYTYSQRLLDKLSDLPVLCSGVVIGSCDNILAYTDGMISEILEIPLRLFGRTFGDQAVHNKLLHSTKTLPFETSKNGDGFIATLHDSDLKEFSFDETMGLLTKDGRPVTVVHQYDRHEGLAAWVWGQ